MCIRDRSGSGSRVGVACGHRRSLQDRKRGAKGAAWIEARVTCAPQLQLLLRAWRRVVTAPRPLTAAAAAATLRSRRDIENVDKQSVQLIVLVSMLPTVPGMLVLVEYSNDEIRPMVATALPALDWFSGRPACPRRPHCPRCPTHNTHTHNCVIVCVCICLLYTSPSPRD